MTDGWLMDSFNPDDFTGCPACSGTGAAIRPHLVDLVKRLRVVADLGEDNLADLLREAAQALGGEEK